MGVRQRVRQFVIDNFYVSDPEKLGDDTSLIQGGFVDSTGMLEVIAFLETEFSLVIEDVELLPENLDTIGRIAAFVARKTAAFANDA